jgi:hypothetical protein
MSNPQSRNDANSTGIPSWNDMLASAKATHQVVALVNEFLARLEPSDVFLLPSTCKPRQLSTAIEVNGYAVDLKMCKCRDVRERQLVEQLSTFVQEACQKLAVLTGPQRAMPESLWDHWDTSRQD